MTERLSVEEMRQLFSNYNAEERRQIQSNGPIDDPIKYQPEWFDNMHGVPVPIYATGKWGLNIMIIAIKQNEQFINWLWYEIIRAKMDGKAVPAKTYQIAKLLRGDDDESGLDKGQLGLNAEGDVFDPAFDIKPYTDKYLRVYLVGLEKYGTQQATEKQRLEALLHDNPKLQAQIAAKQSRKQG